MQETRIGSLGGEDPLEEELATHSSILAWEIPWTEELSGLQSMGSPRVGYDWAWTHTADVERTMWNLVKTPKCIEEAHRDVTMKPKQREQRMCHQEDTCCPRVAQHLPVSQRSFRRAGPRTQLSWVTLPCSLWSPPQRIIDSCSSLATICRMPLTYFPAFFMGLELNALWEKWPGWNGWNLGRFKWDSPSWTQRRGIQERVSRWWLLSRNAVPVQNTFVP